MWLRLAPYAVAAVLASGAVWYVMSLQASNTALIAENERLTRSLAVWEQQAAQSRLAREVEAARAERWQARAKELSDTIEAIREIPYDTPLDPAILDLLDGLHNRAR